MTPALPNPRREIRLVHLATVAGPNYWSRAAVTRVDLELGAFDEISSADVSGLTERLMSALPGLYEHRCSIGRRGGFGVRLRRGTYAAHILEHLALELQQEVGHDVGFGRARGGDVPGSYTVVFEHQRQEVGLRAAELALGLVHDAFAGEAPRTAEALDSLRSVASNHAPDRPVSGPDCLVIGGPARRRVRDAIRSRLTSGQHVIDLSAGEVLREGVAASVVGVAVILDADADDVPPRFRAPAEARRLHAVVADAVAADGYVVIPAGDSDLRRLVEAAGCRVATFHVGAERNDDAGSGRDRDEQRRLRETAVAMPGTGDGTASRAAEPVSDAPAATEPVNDTANGEPRAIVAGGWLRLDDGEGGRRLERLDATPKTGAAELAATALALHLLRRRGPERGRDE